MGSTSDLKGSVGLGALLDHLPELGPVGDEAARGLVHVLAGDGVAVGLGVVFKRPQLGDTDRSTSCRSLDTLA